MTTVWNKWYPLPHGRMLHVFGDAREFDYKLLRGHSAPIANGRLMVYIPTNSIISKT